MRTLSSKHQDLQPGVTMEDTTKFLKKLPKPSAVREGSDASLVNIYPTGPAMGSRYPLGSTVIVLGRDADCHIQIGDESVSRRHACIQADTDGYHVVDLQSTNGTFVNQTRITRQKLEDGDYLYIGNAIYRYLDGGNAEAQYHEEVYRLTVIDGLTGIHNKRYFLEVLERDLACAVRHRRPLALVLFDVDRFKAVNDRLGHLAGDFTLRELANCVRGLLRQEDLFARYGGDEFAVVMPETTGDEALQLSQRVRQVVESHPFQYDNQPLQITISMGVTATAGHEQLSSAEFIRRADDRLYQAKHEGRNRVLR